MLDPRLPNTVALEDAEGAVAYDDLRAGAERTARRLAALGVGAGDRVASTLPAGRELAFLLHAMPLLGAALVPLNTRLADAERRDHSERAGARLVVREPLAGPEADVALRAEPDPDAVLTVIFTSGSTALPKPVELTYANHTASARAASARVPLGAGDRWLCVLPLFHVGGLSILVRCALAGATAVIHDGFDPVRAARALGEVTVASLVPTMLRRMDVPARPPRLRAILLGGGPIPEELLGSDLPLLPTYGMTETCSQVATAEPGERAARPLPGVELRIADGGEILVRGPMVARGALAPDGWLHTGDRGRLDDEGRLHVEGRIKDVIVTGGENVSAPEVEEALLAHPAVADAAVTARPDPEWGEVVVAHVVLRDPVEDAALEAWCRDRLAGYKVPRAFVRRAEIPRTPAGKVQRGRLA